MTNIQKHEILTTIIKEISRLGSANKVAVKCGVSSATLSNIINANWSAISVEMWQKVAAALDINFTGWQLAETGDFKRVTNVIKDAKKEKLFLAISNPAGSGKSAVSNYYRDNNFNNAVYYISAREWARREFLMNLAKNLGINTADLHQNSVDTLGSKVIEFFEKRASYNPVLIIDEADKLKPPAFRFLIPFFNSLEDKVGVVIIGTENLKKEIERGVRLKVKGYDELASRFGRRFIPLIGCKKTDLTKIAKVNGLEDNVIITKIWNECEPNSKTVMIGNDRIQIKVINDLRRVKRCIKRELLNIRDKVNQIEVVDVEEVSHA